MAQHPTDRIPGNFATGDQGAGHPQPPQGEGMMSQFLREVDSAGAHLISAGTSESAFAQAPLPPEKANITHIDCNLAGLYDSVMTQQAA